MLIAHFLLNKNIDNLIIFRKIKDIKDTFRLNKMRVMKKTIKLNNRKVINTLYSNNNSKVNKKRESKEVPLSKFNAKKKL